MSVYKVKKATHSLLFTFSNGYRLWVTKAFYKNQCLALFSYLYIVNSDNL